MSTHNNMPWGKTLDLAKEKKMANKPLTIKEAFELKYLFCPKCVIDDGGRRTRFKEAIRALYMNGYKVIKEK